MAQQTTPDVGTEYEGPKAPHRLDRNHTFVKEVGSIEEAREAQKHAEALGFELAHALFRGAWVAQNRSGEYDHACHLSGDVKPILGLGRTWFLTEVDGRVERVKPEEGGSATRDQGTLVLEFVEGGN